MLLSNEFIGWVNSLPARERVIATPAPRYCDYYQYMSYADFNAWVNAGMPTTFAITNNSDVHAGA